MKKKVFLFLTIILFLFQFSVSAENMEQKELKAAIIIDDFGGGLGGVQDFLEGNVPITAAVMPFTDKSKEHAEWAHKNGLEVMIHLPMEPKKGKRSWLGPKPITVDLTPDEVRLRVLEAIQSVPYAIGLNNHMGSLAVEDEKIVRAIVEVAKEKNLFIIDSRTSMGSKFPELAKELGVPLLMRDVFLDDISSATHVKKQMIRLAKVTEIKGTGIGIGHVGIKGKACSTGVFESIAEFNKRHIRIVPVSELIRDKKVDKNFPPY